MPDPFYALNDTNSVTLFGYQVWQEDVDEDFNPTDPVCTLTLACLWTDRFALAVQLGGGYDPTTGVYSSPKPHPAYAWLWCRRVRIKPRPAQDGITDAVVNGQHYPAYRWASLTVEYRRLPFDPAQVQQGEISVTYGNTIVAAPRGKGVDPYYTYDDDGKDMAVDDVPPIKVPTATLVLTRYNCSTPGTQIAFSLGGKVNSDTAFGAGPGTLLFDGVDSDKQISLGGRNQWTNKLRMLWNGKGWNKFYNPRKNQFTTITPKNGAAPPFESASFAAVTGFI